MVPAFRPSRWRPLLGLLLLLAPIPYATAQEDAECFLCHSDPSLTTEAKDGAALSLYVDEEVYQHSVHAEIGCVACHLDISELPHPEELAPVDCSFCHDETEVYRNSLHGKALINGDGDISGCSDCHGKHDTRRGTDPLSQTHPANLPATCGKCHSDPALAKRHMFTVSDPSEAYLKSIHGRETAGGENGDAAVCNDCHGTHDIQPAFDSQSPIHRMNVPDTCGACHADIAAEFMTSIHGQALAAGIPDAPTCTNCHGEHDIIGPGEELSPVNLQNVGRRTCPSCHDQEEVMQRYGVDTHRAGSYMDSYHNLTTAARGEVVATCVSCHGVHNILGPDDPASSIHPGNVMNTCAQCHDDAGPHFAEGAVHIMPASENQWILGLVRLVYLWLIALVLGGMALHNFLLLARHALNKLRAEKEATRRYRRFTRGETLGHVVLLSSFIALAISGFALRYPDTWFTHLMFVGQRGIGYRSLIHRVAAIVFVAITSANLLYILFTRRGRREAWQLWIHWGDIKDVFASLAYALGLRAGHPAFGRYSYREKFEYWGLWWGSILMIVTGFGMWYADWFLARWPKIALDAAALIHFYEAILAVGTIVVWHFYFVFFDPDSFPINWTWLTGEVTEERMKKHHPREAIEEQHEMPQNKEE